MKTLYFDVEHGSQTLGSKETIGKYFGLPMLSPSSWDEFQSTIGKLYTNKKVTEKVDMGDGFTVDQVTHKIETKGNLKVDTVVVDTFSELSKKFMRTLTDKSGRMKLQEWGRLKNKLDTCLEFVTRIPGNVICTCHARTQTMDSGENRLQPYIDGSTKEDISKCPKKPFAIIDGRMGAEHYQQYNITKPSLKKYLETWYTDDKGSPEPCNAKATSYCSNMSGSFIANVVRKLVTGQPYDREISFNFPTNIIWKKA